MSTATAAPAYEGLLYTVFQHMSQSPEARAAGKGLALAFTSASSGEGVTHIVQALLGGLVRDGASRTLVVDSAMLRKLTLPASELKNIYAPLPGPRNGALFTLVETPEERRGTYSWDGSWEYRRDCIEQLRGLFDYILIDCPALRESNDLLALAPFATGVILVVEANKTRRDQVAHAEKQIEFARGKLIGHILNKRSYIVPDWIYRRL